MSASSAAEHDRQLVVFAVAGIALVALGVLAATFAGGGAAVMTAAGDSEPGASVLAENRTGVGLVGGGSLGGAARNPIGRGVGNESNPFRNRSSTPQFVVSGAEPAYWRGDAYDTYANGTWVRTGAYEPYRGRLDPSGRGGETVTYNVSLRRRAAVLPTSWQPATVAPANASDVAVSAERGIHLPTETAAGETYTVSRYRYAPPPERLVTARAMYPDSIETRYGTPANGTAERVTTLGENITAEAVTPVQAACRTEAWIESNTEYDADAQHDPGSDPVEQFLFETQRGNAEYAASSMVVLLRSQGIPARYVTGYLPGEPVAGQADTYTVRAMDAHAWVEVYVSGHGWTPFDPTPVAAHDDGATQAASGERDAVAAATPAVCSVDVDVAPLPETGAGSAVERDEPVSTPAATPEASQTGAGGSASGVNATLGGTNVTVETDPDPLVIGGEATVAVTSTGDPVANGTVRVRGEPVGTTNATGRLSFTVPAGLAAGEVPLTVRTDTVNGGELVAVAAFQLTPASDRVLAWPGERVAVQATVGDAPIAGVPVAQNGSVIATTDANGTVQVPVSAAPTTTVSAGYVGRQATARIENRLLNTAVRALGVVVIIAGVLAVLAREYDVAGTARGGAVRLAGGLRRGVAGVVARGRRLPALGRAARRRGIRASLTAIGQWLRHRIQRVRAWLPASLLGYLFVLAVQLYRALTGTDTGDAGPDASDEPATAAPAGTGQLDADAGPATWRSIRAVWDVFVGLVFRRVPATRTPGEIARTAIANGFPREPVLRLTNAFRAAAYGPSREDDETLVDDATTALDAIKQAVSTTAADEPERDATPDAASEGRQP
jgi:transglutaminase-like putative cysteine protease